MMTEPGVGEYVEIDVNELRRFYGDRLWDIMNSRDDSRISAEITRMHGRIQRMEEKFRDLGIEAPT